MHSLPFVALAVSWLVNVALVAATLRLLPALVAVHFNFNDLANGRMPRGEYLSGFVLLAAVLPLLLAAAVGLLPRAFPRSINLPHRDYWLATAQRKASLGFLLRHGAWLGALHALFASGGYALLLDANLRAPPRLDPVAFITLLVSFAIAICLWVAVLMRRFGAPRRRP